MGNEGGQRVPRRAGRRQQAESGLPTPTASFRRRAWLEFQRAIDPLAPPKPLRISRH